MCVEHTIFNYDLNERTTVLLGYIYVATFSFLSSFEPKTISSHTQVFLAPAVELISV